MLEPVGDFADQVAQESARPGGVKKTNTGETSPVTRRKPDGAGGAQKLSKGEDGRNSGCSAAKPH